MTTKRYAVVVQYQCGIGDKGDVISRHKTYELARAASKRTGYDSFLAIREIN